MYGNHKYGTYRKSDLNHSRKASSGHWRTRDGERHPVRVRRMAVAI